MRRWSDNVREGDWTLVYQTGSGYHGDTPWSGDMWYVTGRGVKLSNTFMPSSHRELRTTGWEHFVLPEQSSVRICLISHHSNKSFLHGVIIWGGHKSYLLLVVAIASPNGLTWYLSSDQYEEEESVVVHDRRMPLYLNSHRIVEVEETISVSIWQHWYYCCTELLVKYT